VVVFVNRDSTSAACGTSWGGSAPRITPSGSKARTAFVSFPVVGRDHISRIAQHRDDVVPESLIGLDYQQFPCLVVNTPLLLGWSQSVAGYSLPASGSSSAPLGRESLGTVTLIIKLSLELSLAPLHFAGRSVRASAASAVGPSCCSNRHSAGVKPRVPGFARTPSDRCALCHLETLQLFFAFSGARSDFY
jgi:hypothetical protein